MLHTRFLQNSKKILYLAHLLNVIFEKLKSTIFSFIELLQSPEKNANEILCKQNSSVIEDQNVVENYFSNIIQIFESLFFESVLKKYFPEKFSKFLYLKLLEISAIKG